MKDEDHFRKLERMYMTAPCNQYYRPEMKISRGAAQLTIQIGESFFNSLGSTHGSVYFKALDDAAFFACNSLVKDFHLLTLEFKIIFARPVSKGYIRAVGKVLYVAKAFLVGESILYDQREKEIARGSGTFTKTQIRLTPDVGYALGS